MNEAHKPTSVPDCGCDATVRLMLRDMGVEAHVTHVAPLIPTPYEDLAMTCPHGVTWHTEPTSEQIAKYAKEGIA